MQKKPDKARNRKRLAVTLLAVALAAWMLYHPKRLHSLFLAMPPDASIASYHQNIAAELKGAFRNKTIVPILANLGIYDTETIEEDTAGIYWTAFWLTGADTVAGYVPANPYYPESHDYIAAASHVGWRSEIMEILWRIKWVPGLGKLSTTDTGTRYLTFKDFKNAEGTDIVLAMDVVDGMLLATLSTHPETVRLLAARVHALGPNDTPAIAFASQKPWQSMNYATHQFWVYDPLLTRVYSPIEASLSSLAQRDFTLSLSTPDPFPDSLPPLPPFKSFDPATTPGAGVPDDAAAILLATGTAAASYLGQFAPPLASGCAVAYISGKPYQGRIAMLASPALNIAAPFDAEADFSDWTQDTQALAASSDSDLRFESENSALFFIHPKIEPFGRSRTSEMAFVEKQGDFLLAGSHYGSQRRQREMFKSSPGSRSIADSVNTWIGEYPDAFAALRVDLGKTAEESRHIGAIAQIAMKFDGSPESRVAADYIAAATQTLNAIVPLGTVECVAEQSQDGDISLTITTSSGGN